MKTKYIQYNGFLVIMLYLLMFSQPASAQKGQIGGQIGLGGGLLHGMFGLNGEMLLLDHIGLTIGAGSIDGLNCWITGVRYYLQKSESPYRLRLGLAYGVVDFQIVTIEDFFEEKAVVKGFFPSVGADLKLYKNLGLNFDIGYRLPSKDTTTLRETGDSYFSETIEENEKGIDFSIGLSYHF